MTKIRSMLVDQSIMGGPERRGDERSEAPRSGGSPIIEPDAVPVPPDSEVPARHARRRFTTAYKLAILRRADACTRYGELGALLRGAVFDVAPAARGRVDAEETRPEDDVAAEEARTGDRRLTSRLQKRKPSRLSKKKFPNSYRSP